MLLRKRAPELFALWRPANYEQTIATTWTVALDRIRAEIGRGLVAYDAGDAAKPAPTADRERLQRRRSAR